METFASIIDTLVLVSGFLIWILFVPQIRLLLKEKQSRTNSLFLQWGSLLIQICLLIQVILRSNYQLAFVQAVSIVGVTITLILIHYYRRYPGGRKIQKGT